MVGQAPKVHLVQAVGMLVIKRCQFGGWESLREKGGEWQSQQILLMSLIVSLHFWLKAGSSYGIKTFKVSLVVIFGFGLTCSAPCMKSTFLSPSLILLLLAPPWTEVFFTGL
ncbi:hypothetical protein XENORESO_003794 [Xenotaenia resolanae]|uniref:Uncharacterized protein n=1 Tax=Xenotaenia resolanae TaxID=208358 RepID=A0ABV0WP41_9TELE